MSNKLYIDFKPEAFEKVRTAVIDGDGFAWAIGWIFKDALFEKEVTDAVDTCMHDILIGIQAEHYIGVLAPSTPDVKFDMMGNEVQKVVPNFRKAIAKSRPYKGNRPERPEWYLKWAPIVEKYLEEAWGFIHAPEGYEADDLVATLMFELAQGGAKPTCCGNDKDLLQIPGEHFNVVKKTRRDLDAYQASYQLWTQCLMGDATDGILGIPGMGAAGAEKVLGGIHVHMGEHRLQVVEAYTAKFGEDMGIQKFYENYMLVKLRTDVPTDHLDITKVCKGYDLEYWNNSRSTSSQFEQAEEIPDFSEKGDTHESI